MSGGGLLHIPAGEGLVKRVAGDECTMKATKSHTAGSLALIEAVVPPGGGPIAHAHTDEDEAARSRSPGIRTASPRLPTSSSAPA